MGARQSPQPFLAYLSARPLAALQWKKVGLYGTKSLMAGAGTGGSQSPGRPGAGAHLPKLTVRAGAPGY